MNTDMTKKKEVKKKPAKVVKPPKAVKAPKTVKATKVVETPKPVEQPTAPVEQAVAKSVVFENATVVEVVNDHPNGLLKLCRMSDGTTKHVPVELFK